MRNVIVGLCLLALSLPVFASDMAGVGLAAIIIELGLILLVVLMVAIFSRSKKILYFVYGLDGLVVFESLIVFSHNWKLEDDIFMRNVLILQLVLLLLLTFIIYKRSR